MRTNYALTAHPCISAPAEYRLLEFFMQHPEKVYSRAQLLDFVWGQNTYIEERTVDVHVLRLRKTLKTYAADQVIQTIRGAGYLFSATETTGE
ncbi:winged helix-turn-helix domain-containing protein [Thiothrix subterranea]|uniref:winged helix-turn-helix domain-containing protein n=1 Tax=Thiothrix subterranea TaxID=2735563 RepID=UPI0040402978